MNRPMFVSIRKKLVLLYFIIVVLTGVMTLVSLRNMKQIETSYRQVTDSLYALNDMADRIEMMRTSLGNFADTRDRNYVDVIYNNLQDFEEELDAILENSFDLESSLYLKNISALYYQNYVSSTENLIWAVRATHTEEALRSYDQAIEISDYMKMYMERTIDRQMERSQELNIQIRERTDAILRNYTFLLIWMMTFLGFVIYANGGNLVKNISKLHKAAEEVSQGNFDIPEVQIESNDELGILSQAFNHFIGNTRALIQRIKENANLDIQLHREKAEKLEMEALLKQAELQSLQAQINPHFLFNTMNVIAKTAIIEDADQTCTLIETVSDMFRYNLRKMDSRTTIGEEIENVENYFYIQKTRFGERIQFELDIDPQLLDIEIPNLSLQPLIENAFIHGIEQMEDGGLIRVQGRYGDVCTIAVTDNGAGIDAGGLKRIQSGEALPTSGHTTGIGLSNVKRRLDLFFNADDVLKIHSEVGKGTTIEIAFVKPGSKEDSHVSRNDR